MYGGGGDEDDQSMGFETMRMMVTSPTGQWGPEETRELIAIRGELEKDSSVAKRSKALWEAVSSKMSARGFNRTSEQCKCKWKNLLIRYKVMYSRNPNVFSLVYLGCWVVWTVGQLSLIEFRIRLLEI